MPELPKPYVNLLGLFRCSETCETQLLETELTMAEAAGRTLGFPKIGVPFGGFVSIGYSILGILGVYSGVSIFREAFLREGARIYIRLAWCSAFNPNLFAFTPCDVATCSRGLSLKGLYWEPQTGNPKNIVGI